MCQRALLHCHTPTPAETTGKCLNLNTWGPVEYTTESKCVVEAWDNQVCDVSKVH